MIRKQDAELIHNAGWYAGWYVYQGSLRFALRKEGVLGTSGNV